MNISPAVRRRIKWGTGIGILLVALVVTLLTFADSYAINDGLKHCALTLSKSKWPMYFGCAMAAHEDLAGGLWVGAGAIWAAWLAFQAVQEQLDEERERKRKLQADGKKAVVMCITPLLDAAAATLAAIDIALRATSGTEAKYDEPVALGAKHVQAELASFTELERTLDLAADDRLFSLAIISQLNGFVNISNRPSPLLNRVQRLNGQRSCLMPLHFHARGLNAQLAENYAAQSKTIPPNV